MRLFHFETFCLIYWHRNETTYVAGALHVRVYPLEILTPKRDE
jgi:hypothetical protein